MAVSSVTVSVLTWQLDKHLTRQQLLTFHNKWHAGASPCCFSGLCLRVRLLCFLAVLHHGCQLSCARLLPSPPLLHCPDYCDLYITHLTHQQARHQDEETSHVACLTLLLQRQVLASAPAVLPRCIAPWLPAARPPAPTVLQRM
jgi:hypothetical protein